QRGSCWSRVQSIACSTSVYFRPLQNDGLGCEARVGGLRATDMASSFVSIDQEEVCTFALRGPEVNALFYIQQNQLVRVKILKSCQKSVYVTTRNGVRYAAIFPEFVRSGADEPDA